MPLRITWNIMSDFLMNSIGKGLQSLHEPQFYHQHKKENYWLLFILYVYWLVHLYCEIKWSMYVFDSYRVIIVNEKPKAKNILRTFILSGITSIFLEWQWLCRGKSLITAMFSTTCNFKISGYFVAYSF